MGLSQEGQQATPPFLPVGGHEVENGTRDKGRQSAKRGWEVCIVEGSGAERGGEETWVVEWDLLPADWELLPPFYVGDLGVQLGSVEPTRAAKPLEEARGSHLGSWAEECEQAETELAAVSNNLMQRDQELLAELVSAIALLRREALGYQKKDTPSAQRLSVAEGSQQAAITNMGRT